MENPLTAMSINPNPGLAHLFAAGFGDGTIRVYDYRQPDDAVMRTYRDHTHWIQNVCWRGSGLMSARCDFMLFVSWESFLCLRPQRRRDDQVVGCEEAGGIA